MDYAVRVTVRNGRILRMMAERGIDTQAELARRAGVNIVAVNSVVTLRRSPIRGDGEWSYGVREIAAVLGCDPDDLFSDVQRTLALRTNNCEVYMDEASLAQITGGSPEESTWAKIEAQRLLGGLNNPRQVRIVEEITSGRTFKEVGEQEYVSIERVRQIYMSALRRMKASAKGNAADVERNLLLEHF